MFFIEVTWIFCFFMVNLSYFSGKKNLMSVKLFISLQILLQPLLTDVVTHLHLQFCILLSLNFHICTFPCTSTFYIFLCFTVIYNSYIRVWIIIPRLLGIWMVSSFLFKYKSKEHFMSQLIPSLLSLPLFLTYDKF